MREEVACTPSRILVKSHAPLPSEFYRLLGEAAGRPVEPYMGECREGDLVVYSPRSTPPRAGCMGVQIPHVTLLAPLLAEASRDWCRFTGDPEVFYYEFTVKEADEMYRGYQPAWEGRPRVPVKPPPILVASEVYVRDPAGARGEAEARAASGADIIVVGGGASTRRGEYEAALKLLSKDYTVFADAPGLITPTEAYHLGASGWMSLTPCELDAVEEEVRGELAFTIIPSRLSGARERFEELRRAHAEARALGYRKIVVDPVLQPLVKPGALEGLYAAWMLGAEGLGPIMLGVNNVYELLDADTYGSIPLLVGLAGEACASIVLVSEESVKSRGATLEAAVASRLVGLALKYGTPPKDYPYNLLLGKGKGRSLTGQY